jgi:hypothetical protein
MDDDTTQFEDVPDGCGCTEIWEYLSERRNQDAESVDTEEESADAEA